MARHRIIRYRDPDIKHTLVKWFAVGEIFIDQEETEGRHSCVMLDVDAARQVRDALDEYIKARTK